MKRYVVIGNGISTAGCIEGIKSADKEAKITVISAEKHPVYCRPLISYYLEGKTTLEKMLYRKESFYKDNDCTVIYGKKAVEIDKVHKHVKLEDETTVSYDTLCIATGSSPFVPPFEGLDTVQNKFAFMTIDDTLAIEKTLSKNARVLIVGAGLIGLKCAEGIADRVGQITVCDLQTRILSSILDDTCASIMQNHLQKHNISFLLGDTAKKFDRNKAYMQSGKIVEFDILVLAVGVRANTQMCKAIGIEVNRGILVNDRMETSIEGIYAAGDCTEGNDISLGEKRVLAILPNAYMQGYTAGQNMAGTIAEFNNAIPMNSIGFFGLHAMTAGSYFDESTGGEVYEEKTEHGIKRLYTKDDLLTGYILIGDVARAGIYTSLIRDKTSLKDINLELLHKNPSLAIFFSEKRREKLGGVI
ncbi:MAG: FAD-dependent oxidoreductase [Clostridia bacterium]|nr:FAD-dependent oxidoreductase [Clostridia bacterium]